MGKEHYIKFILYTAVIVLVNIVGLTLFFRADLTENRIFSLSDASKQVVSTLSEPLSIKVFFSNDLPAPHNNTERYLRDLLEEYAARSGRQFNYSFYNVSGEDGDITASADRNRDIAKDYGIQPVQIRIMENDEIKFKNAYMGLVIIHGDLIEKIPAITSTDGLEYKLTTAIQKLNNKVSALMRLDDKVTATLYLSSGLNRIAPLINLQGLPMLADEVKRRIEEINTRSMGIIQFSHKDVNTRDEVDKLAKQYDLMAMSWPEIPEQNIPAGHGAAALVLEYKDQAKSLPLISALEIPIIGTTYQMADPQGLGEQITAIMEKLIGINKDIGYLSDHGCPALGPDRMAMMQGRAGNGLAAFDQLVGSRYNIKQTPLKDESIPEGLNCLIIAKPTQPFSDYDLFQIDQALMKGTNIAVFADAFEQQQGQGGMMGMPSFAPVDTGLEKLLAHYGVEIQKAYLLDKNAYKQQLPRSQGGGEKTIYFAPVIKESAINNDPVFMKNIKGLVAMQISPVKHVKGGQDETKVSAVRLLSSSDQAWLMEDNINLNPMFLSPPPSDKDLSTYDLAYLLEGQFTSYFKGKPLPEKDAGETGTQDGGTAEGPQPQKTQAKSIQGLKAGNRVIETSAPAKIFVLGCVQMLHDNMLDEEGRSTNATFLLNTIDHLNGDDGTALLRSKQQTLNPIEETAPLTKSIIKGFNIIGLCVIVFLFGLAVWFFRSMKKKKIAAMFG
ncbi:MAG: Gldg family protein [Desulfobacterales bacterium]|nr:Gldg family protein [Desulfobacterales bacterium]